MSTSVKKTAGFIAVGNAFPTQDGKRYEAIKTKLTSVLREIAESEENITFISGMEHGAGLLAARTVLELKKAYPGITLECALPYETVAANWDEDTRDIFFDTVARCDRENLLQTRYTDDATAKMNRYIKDNSDITVVISTDGVNEDTVFVDRSPEIHTVLNKDC